MPAVSGSIATVPTASIGKKALGACTCVAIGLLVANCSQGPQRLAGRGSEYFPESRYGKASPKVVADGETVPKGGGRHQVGSAYTVAGRTYVPREMNRNYSAIGLASWYGSAFHGRRTANGEVYDKLSFTAAHPTMPLPSYARVTNLDNGRSMIVRVNDRGPFHGGRVMDVSERVAMALDFKRIGTARVKVEHMAPAGLAGSDDRKLLASLRIDGKPATLPGLQQQDVQVASVEPALTSLRQQGAAVPISRAPSTVLASTAPVGDAADEPVAEQEDAAAPVAPAPLAGGRQLVATLASSKPLAPAPGIPLPPERPFNIGPEDARISSLAAPQSVGAGSRVAVAPAYRSTQGSSQVAQRVAYFAPQADLVSRFGADGPFRSLDQNGFAPKTATATSGWTVAIGVFRDEQNARRIEAKLGSDVARVAVLSDHGVRSYRVTAGPFTEPTLAEATLGRARAAGASDARLERR